MPDDPDGGWDFGHGAGFYVNATAAPWTATTGCTATWWRNCRRWWRPSLPIGSDRRGISGHSMGGHGALVFGLRHPGRYASVSAFAPIAHPSACPWGRKALRPSARSRSGALGRLRRLCPARNRRHAAGARRVLPFLVDQGKADPFSASSCSPSVSRAACGAAGQPLELRLQQGYDHSYFFIASFIDDHLRHHARALIG